MTKVKSRLLIVCVAVSLLCSLGLSSASAVTILYQGPNVDIYLGKPFNSLEFEDPTAIGKWVQSYRITDWCDADYQWQNWYDEWNVSHPGAIHGNANEIWMRNAGHSIWTQTQIASTVVSVHLVGDYNDGKAEVRVDGILHAILDMGTRGTAQTALVIVKYLPPMTHKITVKDMGVGPSNLGDDVAVLGAAALGWRKWFPHYWFLDCRIRLMPTPVNVDTVTGQLMPVPVVIPNGWWGGWWWWHHQCCWLRPWLGPIWRYRPWYPWPYWRYRADWPYWPYYRYYNPWWNNWRWRGGPWFWGFKKCLHYRWKPWWPGTIPQLRPPIIYWWSYYWDPEGEGHCVEMVTQSDEENPGGGRIRPVEQDVIDNFEVISHQFAVNGGEDFGGVEGDFGPLDWVAVGHEGEGLVNWLLSQGALPQDVDDFMKTEIVQQLIKNSQDNPDPDASVGLQYARWPHPEPAVTVSAESIVVTEGGDMYEYEVDVVDPVDPMTAQMVVVMPSSKRLNVGMGPGEAVELHFDPSLPQPQIIPVMVEDDDHSQGTEIATIAHFLAESPTGGGGTPVGGGVVTQVTIQDNDCGGLGFAEGDINKDCKVNLFDFAEFADDWLGCTDPQQP